MKRTWLFLLALIVATVAAIMPHIGIAAAATVAQLSQVHHTMTPDSLVFLVAGAAIMGTLKQVLNDNDTFPARRGTTDQYNKLALWTSYNNRNRLLSTTVATLPVCARATTATKAKTTNATVVLASGAAVAVSATDNAWTLTGANLSTGKTRKYLLLVDSTGAVFTVQASDDQATAGNCSFSTPAIQADGTVIVGVAIIANASGADFVPATTALNATGITTTFIDGPGDDSVLPFGQLLPT